MLLELVACERSDPREGEKWALGTRSCGFTLALDETRARVTTKFNSLVGGGYLLAFANPSPLYTISAILWYPTLSGWH